MPKVDQLEIIAPDGRIYFHDLDPTRGITNIGSHPDNEIVIDWRQRPMLSWPVTAPNGLGLCDAGGAMAVFISLRVIQIQA